MVKNSKLYNLFFFLHKIKSALFGYCMDKTSGTSDACNKLNFFISINFYGFWLELQRHRSDRLVALWWQLSEALH